ncbi:MAG TPA: ATP-binding protein [Candidatus Acidoferrales bacterium]|jgi:PAS domain S-box-containing protein|nr:ATP-binding protein [Candidatus Acidoferrales bacterium]
MQLRLKTKITLATAALVLAVVGVNSTLYVMNLSRQVIRQADERAQLVSKQVFFQAQVALADAAKAGEAPDSNSSEDLREYAQKAFDESASLASSIDAQLGYSPLIYEISISDVNGKVLVSSDKSMRGNPEPIRAGIEQLVSNGFVKQLRVLYSLLYGPPLRAYEVTYPFQLGPPGQQIPFGAVRVAVQTGLLRASIIPALRSAALLAIISVGVSVLLAGIVSSISLAPLKRITAQLDRIAKGEFDQKPLERGDEFGQVSTKISQIGMQLRGVREIFSNLRENIDQVLGGLDDGLLLFSVDGRAVMVSPAVERFLSTPADQLLGRRAEDIFPPDHDVRSAIKMQNGEFEPVASAEAVLRHIDGPPRRVGVSVEVIGEGDMRMGTLVKFKDLESRERIGTQLQVSERLANLGRITAGVAHEVKNPLNSMRIWLENLKASLPDVEGLPLQAVRVLDSEIDRLDSVVKRFLDFTRPPDMHQEEANLKGTLEEVLAVEKPELDKANIKLEAKLASNVPNVLVDKLLLKQALVNLILNAIEAMPKGGQLSVSLNRRDEMAEIEIRDTGRGIAPEHRQRIFQLFFTTRAGGSGIGLASTFRTVQLHNGSIEFESEVGRGTTFRIDLPLAHQMEPALSRPRDSGAAVAGRL